MRWIRLALTYSAVATLAAAGYLTTRGELAAPIVLSFLSLGFVGVRAQMDVDVLEVVVSRLPRREKLIAPALAVLLVTAALSGAFGAAVSPVEPAAATHECSETEKLVTFSFGLTGYATDKLLRDGKCTDSHRAQAIEDLKQSDANQTETDIYNAGLEAQAETETTRTLYQNYLNDTEASAWMQAEMAVAQAYENGSSKSLAKSKAREAIADYYAVKQYNLIRKFEVHQTSYHTLKRRAINESNVSGNYVSISGPLGADGGNTYYQNLTDVSVTLVNGTSVTYQTTDWEQDARGDYKPTVDGSQQITYEGETWNMLLLIKAPNSNYDQLTYYDGQNNWHGLWNKMESQNSALQSEVDVFVNQTWDAYKSGQIDSADVLSRNTQMFRYGNAALNGSESTYDVTAALSSMGLESPELNGTGTMLVNYNGADYYGLVLARQAPNGSWNTGQTYNATNISGPVLLATTAGETKTLSGDFTVKEITAETGENINKVQTQRVVYKTSNTSELLEKMDRILKLREEIESREVTASSGGTGDSKGLLEALATFLGISAGAAAAVLAAVGLLVVRLYTPN